MIHIKRGKCSGFIPEHFFVKDRKKIKKKGETIRIDDLSLL